MMDSKNWLPWLPFLVVVLALFIGSLSSLLTSSPIYIDANQLAEGDAADKQHPNNNDVSSGIKDQQSGSQKSNWHNQKQPMILAVGPVRVSKDRLDYILIISTIIFAAALTGVGAIQARLLYWTYIADHRPRLMIRHLAIIKPEELEDLLKPDPATGITGLVPIDVVYVLTNRGGSKAKIIEGNITLRAIGENRIENILSARPLLPPLDKLTGLPIYSIDRTALVGVKVEPAQSLVKQEALPKSKSTNETVQVFLTIHRRQNMKHLAFYAFGYFRYRDWTKRQYITAFCRRYDAEGDAFVAVKDRRYEYAD